MTSRFERDFFIRRRIKVVPFRQLAEPLYVHHVFVVDVQGFFNGGNMTKQENLFQPAEVAPDQALAQGLVWLDNRERSDAVL